MSSTSTYGRSFVEVDSVAPVRDAHVILSHRVISLGEQSLEPNIMHKEKYCITKSEQSLIRYSSSSVYM